MMLGYLRRRGFGGLERGRIGCVGGGSAYTTIVCRARAILEVFSWGELNLVGSEQSFQLIDTSLEVENITKEEGENN